MPRLDLVSSDVRRLALGGEEIEYTLLRKRGRRGVALRVDGAGLTVSAALTVPLARLEDYIRENERWVLRKVAEWGSRRVPHASWSDATPMPYLGAALALRIAAGARAHVELSNGEMHVTVREHTDEAVRHAVVAWYKRAALAHLAERAFSIARVAGLPMPRVFVTSAAARWGSCNSKREVRLAWRLVKARPELIDYVVCHELAHLRHMNHSKHFWAEVERMCPDYRRRRDELEASDHLYRSF
jgi:predicted metal-dependent hydrolase